jgi:hypothetical protein
MQSGKSKIAAGGGVGLIGVGLISFTLNSISGPGSVSGSIVDVSIFKTDIAIAPVEQPHDAELLRELDREYELLLAQKRRLEK